MVDLQADLGSCQVQLVQVDLSFPFHRNLTRCCRHERQRVAEHVVSKASTSATVKPAQLSFNAEHAAWMKAISLFSHAKGGCSRLRWYSAPRLNRKFTTTHMHMAKRDIQEPIKLTDLERDIFDVLLSTKRDRNLSVVLRCAGGWVRDKLLGLDSLDIDIALDDMMGREFAGSLSSRMRHQLLCIIALVHLFGEACPCRAVHVMHSPTRQLLPLHGRLFLHLDLVEWTS